MRIENNKQCYSDYKLSQNKCEVKSCSKDSVSSEKLVKASSENIKANYLPISFKGNATEIKNAFIIRKDGEDTPLMKTAMNGSYIIDFDSQTEVMYGENAKEYLKKTTFFPYDTQIVIPKKAKGTIETDGKVISLEENSGVIINDGSNAKVTIEKGEPFIILSKKDYNWYERFSSKAISQTIQEKFGELVKHNAHSYNGELPLTYLLPDRLKDKKLLEQIGLANSKNLLEDLYENREKLSEEDKKHIETIKSTLTKLKEKDFLEERNDDYIKFKQTYNQNFAKELFEDFGFNEDELKIILPLMERARKTKMQAVFCRENDASHLDESLINKLKEKGLIYANKKALDKIYWKKQYEKEDHLRYELYKNGFTKEEEDKIAKVWKDGITTGFDMSGLKFINFDLAVYNLNDKFNNWNLDKTNWVTNSTAITSKKGQTPFIGISMVQADEEKVYTMGELRKDEVLHSHPNLSEKRQTELYLITSGYAAMNIVKDGKPQIKILKEGDLAIVEPGLGHCINSVMGEYEQIVVQVPSAFQYGFGFKENYPLPDGYNEEELKQQAKEELRKTKESEN